MRKRLKILLSLFLVFSMLLAISSVSLAQVSDIEGNWAEMQIRDWVEKKLINGLPDGTFKPENPITRAEFSALINRALGFFKKSDFKFNDVSAKEWFAGDISIGKAQGYLIGDGSNAMPNKPISRQEVITILARILKLKPDETAVSKYSDAASIASWAKGNVGAVCKLGYINDYKDNTFKPLQNATRAEVVAILHKAVGTLYNKAGIQELSGGTGNVSGNVSVTKPGITLKNMTINGNLYLTEGIGDGSVTLENVTVTGTTTVSGGGEQGVIILNSSLGNVVVNVPDNSMVGLIAKGSASIGHVDVMSAAKLEEDSLTGKGFGEMLIEIPDGSKVELAGNFDKIDVVSPKAQLFILRGIINDLLVNSKGSGFTLDKSVTINTLTVNQPTKMTGMCVIATAIIHSNDVSIETKPKLIKKDAFLTGVDIGYGAAGGGGGGGGGGPSGGGDPTPSPSPSATPTPSPTPSPTPANATPTPTATPALEITVTDVQDFDDITVAFGTAKEGISFPETAHVTLSDDMTRDDFMIRWDCLTYDPGLPGEYTFNGTLTAPDGSGIIVPAAVNETIELKVIVNKRNIRTIGAIADIPVELGSVVLPLPDTVDVTLIDNTLRTLEVTWDTSSYNGAIAGSYTFPGTLTLPDDVINPNNLTVSVSVVVFVGEYEIIIRELDTFAEKYVPVDTEIDGLLPVEVTAVLSNNSTCQAGVDWNTESYNANALGTYILSGTLTSIPADVQSSDLEASITVNVVEPINDPRPDTHLKASAGTEIDECDSIDGWTWTNDVMVTQDPRIRASGTGSLNISATVAGSGQGYFYELKKVFDSPLNMDGINNVEVDVYIPDITQTNSFSIRFYSDADAPYYANCFRRLISNWNLVNGWNRISIPSDDFFPDETNPASWGHIEAVRVMFFPMAGCKPSVNLDRIAYNVSGRAQILFTFDDGWYDLIDSGITNNAFNILSERNYDATVWAKMSSANDLIDDDHAGSPGNYYLNETDLQYLYDAGWDIGNHTVHHYDNMNELSDDVIRQEFLECQDWLLNEDWDRGAHFACYPTGVYNEHIIDILKRIGVQAARTAEFGLQGIPVDNMYKLKCLFLDANNTVQMTINEIDNAINTGSTVILMLHRIKSGGDPSLFLSPDDFETIVQHVEDNSNRLDVVTISGWYDNYVGNVRATSVDPQDDISVEYGTSFEELGLPERVNVNFNYGDPQSVPVVWDPTTYNPNATGTNTISGTLPPEIPNPGNLTATARVIVTQGVIDSVQPSVVEAVYGTEIGPDILPLTVNVTLIGGNIIPISVVDWVTTSYNKDELGTHTVYGTLAPPTGVTNPRPDEIRAILTITVVPATIISVEERTVPDVVYGTQIELGILPLTVNVTLSNGNTQELDVRWDTGPYNGDVPRTYVLHGELRLPEGVENPNSLEAIVRIRVVETLD